MAGAAFDRSRSPHREPPQPPVWYSHRSGEAPQPILSVATAEGALVFRDEVLDVVRLISDAQTKRGLAAESARLSEEASDVALRAERARDEAFLTFFSRFRVLLASWPPEG